VLFAFATQVVTHALIFQIFLLDMFQLAGNVPKVLCKVGSTVCKYLYARSCSGVKACVAGFILPSITHLR
jgi:hypothetical protein